jgi:putative hydrolase of the HAD superfamily
MPELSLLLWDVGGVILSNAWDHADRAAAAERFGLDGAELERRHEEVADEFEKGRIDEEEYLSKTVFYMPRPFSREAFEQYIRDRSTPLADSLATAKAVRAGGRYAMAALNNESRELNEFRIETFHLKEIFHVFFSSCYTGLRKPDPAAYLYALKMTQRAPEESLLLDDRLDNVKAAASLGLRTLWVQNPGQLPEDLTAAGVVID